MTRRQRRELDRQIARSLAKRGIKVPDSAPCWSCKGTGARLRLWRLVLLRCRTCGGTGRDPVAPKDRFRQYAVRQALEKAGLRGR